jgi:amino acid adenylation domain-containing protein
MMARDGGPPGPPAERPAPPADRPAYVIFTSGSTGVPKGVVVSHRAAARFCRGAAEVLGLGPADRRLQLAPLSFDASVADVFPVLGRGGTLILRAPGPIGSLGSLLSDCRDRRVTVLGLPTALWHELAATDTPLPPSVRRVVFGGEAALAERVLAWRRRAGSGVALLNSYGPTETAVAVATCELAAPGLALGPGGEVPIGRPNLGDRILVLDPEARPVPAGVTGELWVGGPGLARGYLDRPGRTAESFRPDPSVRDGGAPGGRLYRTGDLGRWLPDGTLVFSGRADRQVKVRGYRVELGEVESALAEHPAVRESVVSLVRGPGGVGALVAHAAGSDLDPDRLRTFLGDRLPAWSVPAAIVLLDALPRTPSGKIDRRALPAPDPDAVRGGAGATAPRTDLERRIAAVWEDVLEIRPVGVTDDFFELGGHSLLAVRLAARLERTLGRPFPLATLFEHPTVESLAASLGRGGAPGQAPGRGPVPLLVPLRARPGVLSGSPRRRRVLSPSPLVLVHPAGGSALCYTELARRLEASGSRRPVWGLQAPGFEGEEEPLETVGELAERFLDELEWGLGGAPVRIHLAGWSFGGLVAFELARRLGRRVRRSGNGRRPGVVAVLDAAPGRAAGGHGAGAVHEDEADLLARALSEAVPGVTGDELRGLDHGARMATLMRRARERGVLPPGSEEDLFGPGPEQGAGRLLRVFTASLRAAEAYRPAPFEGDLVLFRATGGSRLPARDPAAAWRPFVRGTTAVVDVPGDHRSVVTGDGARAVAAALAGLLAARDGA